MRMVKIPSRAGTAYVNPIHVVSAKVVDDDGAGKAYVEIDIDNDGGNNFVSGKMDREDALEELERFVGEVNDSMADPRRDCCSGAGQNTEGNDAVSGIGGERPPTSR